MKNKTILVTGGTGFVGAHLVESLIKLGANVIVVDINLDKKSYFYTQNLDLQSTVINLDICNYSKLLNLIEKYKVEFIFHLAAQALVDAAYRDPKHTLVNNIVSTINILEAVRINPEICGLVVASSDKSYGKLHKDKYIETDPLSGDHPYDTSKSATDLITTAYCKTYGIPAVVTRFGNIYGEGDPNMSRIIPGIMNSIINDQTLEIRSDGTFIRDYLYVKDVVVGYILLAQNIDKVRGQAYNFGSDDTFSVLKLIEEVGKTLGKEIPYKIQNTAKNEIPYQSLNFDKIQSAIGWKPKETVSSTANRILDWYAKQIR